MKTILSFVAYVVAHMVYISQKHFNSYKTGDLVRLMAYMHKRSQYKQIWLNALTNVHGVYFKN